jgi:sulfur carrier protein ThiS
VAGRLRVRVQITLKLFAMFSEYLPRDPDGRQRVGHQVPVEVGDGTVVQDVIERFKLPKEQVHLVLVNGRFVAPEDRPRHLLQPGDALAIWPMVAGG